MGMGRNGGPPMPLPPTEVEEPYRLSQLGTQPLLVPVQVTIYLCWHAVCSRTSLRWEWVVVAGPPMPLPPTEVEEPYRLSQLGTQPLLGTSWRSLSTSVGMRYAVDL